MKKLVAAVLALALLTLAGTAALALDEEVTEVRWETYESLIAESGIPAAFRTLGDTGVRAWIPEAFKSIEIPEEAASQGYVSIYSLADASGFIEVTLLEGGEGVTVPSVFAGMQEENLLPELADVNGMDAVSCMVPDSDTFSLMVMFDPGRFLQFRFYPMSDSSMSALASIVAASVQKEGLIPSPATQAAVPEMVSFTWDEAKESARTADPDGRLVQVGDMQMCMWVPSIFQSYALPEGHPDAVLWLATADGSASAAVSRVDSKGVSLMAWQKGLIRYGYTDAATISVNSLPALSYTDAARDTLNVICRIPGGDGMLQFAFHPISNQGFAALTALMVSSIQRFSAGAQ